MASYEVSMLINGASLLLGVGAWVWGILSILAPTAAVAYRHTVTSFGCCTLSVVLQLAEVAHRVGAGDCAAVEDTIRAVLIAATVLTVTTVALGVAALVKTGKN